jgi:hypothetical protein
MWFKYSHNERTLCIIFELTMSSVVYTGMGFEQRLNLTPQYIKCCISRVSIQLSEILYDVVVLSG